MGTTPNLGIPYPENSDLVTNGAAAMQAIAEAADELGDAWTSVSGLTVGGLPVSAAVMRYRRIGKTLHGTIKLTASGVETGAAITVDLPAGMVADVSLGIGPGQVRGQASALRQGAGWEYGLTSLNNATQLVFVTPASTAASATVWGQGADNPIAWAASDELIANFTLELA